MAPKSRRPKPEEPRFLFVNEDANTVLRVTKDAELDRSKQSHVQRQNFVRRKRLLESEAATSRTITPPIYATGTPRSRPPRPELEPASGTQTTDFSSLLDLDEAFATFELGTSLSRRPSTRTLLDPKSNSGSSSSAELLLNKSNLTTIFEGAIAESSQQTTKDGVYQTASDQTYGRLQFLEIPRDPLSGRPDPFTSTKLALELFAPKLIQYYTTVVYPAQFTLDCRVVSLQNCRHTPALHADMQACFQEPAHLYALLATTSARMLNIDSSQFIPYVAEDDYHRVPLFFKTKAIEALRKKLSQGQVDHQVVVDVFRLMTAALFVEDTNAEDAHFQALVQMIDSVGGLDTFDDYTKERIFTMDIMIAVASLSQPKLPLTYCPGDLPPHVRGQIFASTGRKSHLPGQLFLSSSTSDLFQPAMASAISELAEFVQFYIYTMKEGTYVPETFCWMANRLRAIEHRILSFPRKEDGQEALQQECIRIALIFWTSMTLADPVRKKYASQHCTTLKVTLDQTDVAHLWEPHVDLFLWVSTIGALAANNESDFEFSATLAARAARSMKITDLESFIEVMQGFFYLADCQQDQITTLFARFEELSPPDEIDQPPSSNTRASRQQIQGKGKTTV